MVGKVWSDREEKYFWRTAVANSPKRAGIDRAKAEKSWDQLAKDMQRAMGEHARRDYTGTMLFEHYFQNIESQRKSPHAVVYVYEYLKKLGPHRQPPDIGKLSRYMSGSSSRKDGIAETTSTAGCSDAAPVDAVAAATNAAAGAIRGPGGPVSTPVPDFNAPIVIRTISRNTGTLPGTGVFSTNSGRHDDESLFVEDDDPELEEGEIRG
ncbi:hypothetical protein F5X99DRAFT_215187 [Biscogniauxia marginata]|nr:hypothetical protein F5X99DRAFT_215187 [Biscogniauxia marginata]